MPQSLPISEPVERELSALGSPLAVRYWPSAVADAPRVLALHGWLDNAASFDGLAASLAAAGVAVDLAALDLAGHGRSAHRSSYMVVEWVADAARALRELGWGRCTLLGHSLGAGIAALLAGTEPQLIDGLILLEGLTPLTTPPDEAPERLAAFIDGLLRLTGKRMPVYASVDEALAARLRSGQYDEDGGIRAVIERGLRPVAGGFTWASDPRLRLPTPLRLSQEHALAFLRRISCPATLVRARQGWPHDPGQWEELTGAVQGLRVIEVEGGHHVHLDDPVRIAAVVAAALRG